MFFKPDYAFNYISIEGFYYIKNIIINIKQFLSIFKFKIFIRCCLLA